MVRRLRDPLVAWRIADDRYPLLDGGGAFRTAGRWHSPGRFIIYAGLGVAVVLLEKLVRTRIGDIPKRQHIAAITIPADLAVDEAGSADVPGWNDPAWSAARAHGNAWYDEARSAVLLVPSLPAMGLERNVLINQRHPDFGKIGYDPPLPVVWDRRLFLAQDASLSDQS